MFCGSHSNAFSCKFECGQNEPGYGNGNSDNWRKVWTIYTFLVWYEEYFLK